MDKEQQNLFTKKQYYELLKPVIELVGNHKDDSIEELRNSLYEQSGIEDKVKNFIYQKEMVPGMVFTYGTRNYRETVVIGNRQEVTLDKDGKFVPAVEKMTEDTIVDLASVTKIFTTLSILQLVENGTIKLEDKITKYAPEFKKLNEVSIFDLLSFKTPLRTDGRVDGVDSKEKAEEVLFTMYVGAEPKLGTRPYTDMGSMVLKYVIEHASGMNYYNYIDENILKKLKLIDTYVNIPKNKIDRVATTNFETQIMKDTIVNFNDNYRGIINDSKARILSSNANLSGHAGLFSTASDMSKLSRGIIGGQVIDEKYVEMMAKNRTGKPYINDNGDTRYVQYLGFLCYSKNPILADSELFHALSGNSFASGGWTGTEVTVDPINELYFFMYGNRTHNRISRNLSPEYKEKVEIDENGKKTILLPDGNVKIDATRFAWDRNVVVVQPALRLAIQYKMLEDIYSYNKENTNNMEVKNYVRKI